MLCKDSGMPRPRLVCQVHLAFGLRHPDETAMDLVPCPDIYMKDTISRAVVISWLLLYDT